MNEPAIPIPCIPPEAPFSAPQRAWLNGFLAGLFSNTTEPQIASAPVPETRRRITLLFGSQSGNAEKLAYGFAKTLKKAGYEAVVSGMEKFSCAELERERCLLIITSTHGEGDPPDNAQTLHRELHAAQDLRLDALRYSVLALGDRNYEKFCQCGVDFDMRLEQLGAKRLWDRVDADVDYEEPAALWQTEVLAALQSESAKTPAMVATTSTTTEQTESVSIERGLPSNITVRDLPQIAMARLKECRNLHTETSEKETRHVVLEFAEDPLPYQPGDALEIAPENCPELVDLALQASGFPGDAHVTWPQNAAMTLREALSRHCTLAKVSASTLKAFAEQGGIASLQALGDPARAEDLKDFLRGCDIVDLLSAHPGVLREPQALVSLLPKLAPRLYSIASSRKAHPREVHLTVGIVRYRHRDRDRKGVCSTFLADRVAPGASLRVRLHVNPRFRLPTDPATPAILIGPGTGIAPFRAFLQERRAENAPGRNWLFFGNPHVSSDFLYQAELEAWRQEGLLTRIDTAFSRDQTEKIYVQHRMLGQGALIWEWLQAGANLYVCGDAYRMAKDVESALLDIIAQHGSKSPEAARQHLDAIKQAGRYQRDVY